MLSQKCKHISKTQNEVQVSFTVTQIDSQVFIICKYGTEMYCDLKDVIHKVESSQNLSRLLSRY